MALEELKNFNVDAATLSLWVFKKSTPRGHFPSFTGRWVDIGAELVAALKQTIERERDRIEEVLEYSLLAENNEASALAIGMDETHAALIVDRTAAETPQRKVTRVKELKNAAFQVVKLVSADEKVLYAVSKTPSSWKTKRRLDVLCALFTDQALELDDKERFDLGKSVDFFIVGETILVNNKKSFESILSYKAAHQNDFMELQGEPEFQQIFVSMDPLVEYVGQNKIRLRRMSAVRQKCNYRDPAFLENLKKRHAEFGLNLVFDGNGKLVVTPGTCADVVRALLDHRLVSPFSARTYDVPDATPVAV